MINHFFIKVRVLSHAFFSKNLHGMPVMLCSIAVLFSVLIACKDKVDAAPRPEVPVKDGTVRLDNTNIHVMGAGYVARTPQKLSFKRFSEDALNLPAEIRRFSTTYALSTTGISLQFKTKSSSISLTFSSEDGMKEKGAFKILRDGVELKVVTFEEPVSQPIQIELKSLPTDKEYVYEVILPSYTNFYLTKFDLDGVNGLASYTPITKKIYMSFGDSITHGYGQNGCSYLTYPYLLAQKLNMKLYNVAVNGAKISIPTAEMAKDLPQADVITTLIAYNDFSSGNRTGAQINSDYRAYLTELRKSQPSAEIYCITMLFTTNATNATTGLTAAEVRTIVKNIVTEYQAKDTKLHLVEGDKIITSTTQLVDRVHLNVAGASKMCDGLYDIIKK